MHTLFILGGANLKDTVKGSFYIRYSGILHSVEMPLLAILHCYRTQTKLARDEVGEIA